MDAFAWAVRLDGNRATRDNAGMKTIFAICGFALSASASAGPVVFASSQQAEQTPRPAGQGEAFMPETKG
jgi:hypothetical protein